MAKRGQKAKTRATATKRKKPVRKARPASTKSGKTKSGKTNSIAPKSGPPKSSSPKSSSPKANHSEFENARLKSELGAARDRQAASAEVMRLISASPGDADQTLRRIAEIAERLFRASSVSLLIADGEHWGRTIRVGAGSERIATALPMAHVAIMPQYMPGAVYLENRQVHVSDADDPLANARWPGLAPARAAGTRTMSGTPLRSKGQAIGALIVHRDRPVPFTEDELALLQSFADQAGIATENARLINETREALERQTATADVLKVISRSVFDLQTVLDTLVESAYKLCGAGVGLLYLRGDEAFECKAIAGVGVAEASLVFKGRPIRAGRGTAAERVILTGEVHSIPDFFEDPELDPRVREMIRNASSSDSSIGKIRSTLAVPMMRDDAVLGVMVIGRAQTGPFPPSQIELLRTFADQAVIAIENARLFDEVQARTRELAASLDELRTAQDRLVQTEKLASLGQLTAGIAHEIKNPLNFVNNFSALSAELVDELNQVLKPAALDGKVREEIDDLTQMLKGNLEKVVQHGKRADSIVKNMLLHSREGSGEHRSTDINAILDESLNLAYHGARAEKPGFNITLQRDFDAGVAAIDAFPQEITRVFLNLITNGFYAAAKRKSETPDSGFEPVLTATTRNIGHSIEIRIRDNGTGIPADVREKIFNPFFTTKPAGEGTGLGLSMSHDIIVKQHGGSIDVATVPGQFTEFTIVLPRTFPSS
ncbi:GAF domain-containing protein [Bradyrhizobium sp.]|uniref:GAF domain-containing protein n=1 Tax=Bradyrhizobium sp. TaxID=376 RepID=UPI003D0A5A21